jgi:quinol monooxygenase YgiN
MTRVDAATYTAQMTSEVHLLILIETQTGLAQRQIDAFAKLAPLVRAEAGCLQYDLHQVTDKPDRFVLLERWSSSDALVAHGVTAHMLEADAGNGAFRAGPVEVFSLGATLV